MVFFQSSPETPRLASAKTRLPERGLMDPFPLLQELRPSGGLVAPYEDSPISPRRKASAGIFEVPPNTTVAATSDMHDWERQLQENRSRARAASVASNRTELTITLEELDEPPSRPTNVRQRAMHVPTRTRCVASPPSAVRATLPRPPASGLTSPWWGPGADVGDSSNRRVSTLAHPVPPPAIPTAPHEAGDPSGPGSGPDSGSGSGSAASSLDTVDTRATSILPPLQAKGPAEEGDSLIPLEGDDPASFDLVAPAPTTYKAYSLEQRSAQLFSREHLEIIFADSSLLLKFTSFLSTYRPRSIPILIYHLDALKALKAIGYANAVADSLEPLAGHSFTTPPARPTVNAALETKASDAFDVLVRDDLPAYVTHIYTQVVTRSITKRITGTLSPQLRDASEGLAEVFCLSDPTRPDNPIIFASEEFHRTTQYGMSYAIGRNCRFLQGPRTNPYSVGRLRDAIDAGQEHCETFLNYRRDGSPFMNLLMVAPLRDSRGEVRYFIGAQVDVSGIVKECTDLESLRRLVLRDDGQPTGEEEATKDAFQELSEMFNMHELDTVRRWGGRMHKDMPAVDAAAVQNWHRPRLMISDPSPENMLPIRRPNSRYGGGHLSGVYQNYLLVRPHPSLRVLFASPSLRVPGILQSPFLAKIGGSPRVREELTQALADGRGVTAKVRWLTRADEEGRNRWIHCTPLLGADGRIGVWMVVVVDDDEQETSRRQQRVAPPVDPGLGRPPPNPSERPNFPLPVEPQARARSPAPVRTYNDHLSLASSLSLDLDLDLDRPPSVLSGRSGHRNNSNASLY